MDDFTLELRNYILKAKKTDDQEPIKKAKRLNRIYLLFEHITEIMSDEKHGKFKELFSDIFSLFGKSYC